jgi:hypothetical protein
VQQNKRIITSCLQVARCEAAVLFRWLGVNATDGDEDGSDRAIALWRRASTVQSLIARRLQVSQQALWEP